MAGLVMTTFTVWVTAQGHAEITASTLAEARRKAGRGELDAGTIRLQPVTALVSSIKAKKS